MILFFLLKFIAIAVAVIGSEKVIPVQNVEELLRAVESAVSGDEITLQNGIYTQSFSLDVRCHGVTIRASQPGGAIFTASSYQQGQYWKITGDRNTISGLQFINTFAMCRSATICNNVIDVIGSNNTLLHLNFNNVFAKKFINFKAGSQYNRVSYSNFEHKNLASPREI